MTMLSISEKIKDSHKRLDDASTLPDFDALQEPQSRRKTDNAFLIIFVVSIALLFPLAIYTLYYSDINRLKGYDVWGNICGQKNVKYDQWNCTGEDMTLKPVFSHRECKSAHYYDPYSEGEIVFDLMYRAMWKLVLVSFVPLALCLILVVMFRYIPAVAVWSILVIFWLILATPGIFCLFMSIFLWNGAPIYIYCIILAFIFCSCILVNLNYIRLATALLKEATRALFEIKMMSFVPTGALSLLIAILLVYNIGNFHFMTSGKLTELNPECLNYVPDNIMLSTTILSCIITFWVMLFVLGAQYTTVSGAVAQWYTIKDQDNPNAFVPSNLRTTISYHLGTVALGSVMMTIMLIPRLILQFLAMFSALKQKADSWLRCFDGFFTNNTYIITAMYGTSFIQSGTKATKLLKLSIGDTRDLNNFANSVIQIAHIIVVYTSTLAAYITLHHEGIYGFTFIYIEFAIACVCAFAILGTLKVSTNTLFFCATEELLRNHETDLPYNRAMKEFLDGSNKLFLEKVKHRPTSNRNNSCTTIMVILQNISEDTWNFSKMLNDLSVFVVLQRAQNRRKTDTAFLIVLAAVIAFSLPLLIYTLYYSDINRLNKYDNCGNICGQKNAKYDQWECTGQDMTLKPIYFMGECVEKDSYDNVYLRNSYRQEFLIMLSKVVLVSFVALALCLILVVMFRYVPAIAVWSIVIGFWLILASIGLSCIPLYKYSMLTIIVYSIISVLLLCLCIIANMNNLTLATTLLKEATKALFEIRMMPLVLAGALFNSTVILLIFTIVHFHLMTYGKLTEVSPGSLEYVPDYLKPTTMIFSFIMAIWAILFVLGVQYTTVTGAVAQWYTDKDLGSLNNSILSNFRATMKYHLGTVALGSAMMTIMFVPRLILQFLAMFSALKQKADSWLGCLDGFFTTNSYIVTAICGTSFMQSGKRARYLLKFSVGGTRDLNSFANFVILFAQISIVFVSILAMYMMLELLQINYYLYGLEKIFLVELAIACVYVHAILGTLKVSTNTLFFCITEELLRVKETNLPNSMTMKEFLDGSNKLFLQKIRHEIT